MQSMSVLSKPSMNDCSDLPNIRLRKFSISACCSKVILLCGTCLIISHNLDLKISTPRVRKNTSLAPKLHLIYNNMIKTTTHNSFIRNYLE